MGEFDQISACELERLDGLDREARKVANRAGLPTPRAPYHAGRSKRRAKPDPGAAVPLWRYTSKQAPSAC